MTKFWDWVAEKFEQALTKGWERFQAKAFGPALEEEREERPVLTNGRSHAKRTS